MAPFRLLVHQTPVDECLGDLSTHAAARSLDAPDVFSVASLEFI